MDNSEIFAKMRAVVEAPDYQFLKAYKDDFYKHDHDTITNEMGESSRYLWVISPTSTDLTRLGVHHRNGEWAKAAILCRSKYTALGVDIYLVDRNGVKHLTEGQAMAEIDKMDFVIKGRRICDAKGTHLFTYSVAKRHKPGDGNQYAAVEFESVIDAERLDRSTLYALRDIALCEARSAYSSLFIRLESVLINGEPLQELLDQFSHARHTEPELAR